MHADPLPVPDQLGRFLHSHDGRQAVLAGDHRAMGHQAPHPIRCADQLVELFDRATRP